MTQDISKLSIITKKTSGTQIQLSNLIPPNKYAGQVKYSGYLTVKRNNKKLLKKSMVKRFVILVKDALHLFEDQEV